MVSLGAQTRLKFLTGKGAKYREIDVAEPVKAVGYSKRQRLIGLHNFSGADWGGKIVGIMKKSWVKAYIKLDDDNPAVDCFQQLCEGSIPPELIDRELPLQVQGLEQFVCQVYSSNLNRNL